MFILTDDVKVKINNFLLAFQPFLESNEAKEFLKERGRGGVADRRIQKSLIYGG